MVSFPERDYRDQDVFFLESSLYKSFRDHTTDEKIWVVDSGSKENFLFHIFLKNCLRKYTEMTEIFANILAKIFAKIKKC